MLRRIILALALLLSTQPLAAQLGRFCTTNNAAFINCGDINALDGVTALTLAAVVNGDASSGHKTIIAKSNGTALGAAFNLHLSSTEKPSMQVCRSGTCYTAAGTTTAVTVGTLYCLVGTFDTSRTDSVEVDIWVDGTLEGQATGPNAAANAVTNPVTICNEISAGANDFEERVYYVAVEARAWREPEIKDFCAGNLAVAQRAGGSAAGGFLPLWDNAADPGTYAGTGVFAGACTAATDPTALSDFAPRSFIGGVQ